MPRLRPLRRGRFVELEPLVLRGLGPRRVRAYVPASRKGDGPRPLLVLFDGQNVFDDHGSFAGGWFAHEAIDQIGRWRPVPPLVVAVDHGHHARIDELTPFSDGKRGGKLDVVGDAIVDELLPRIHARFDLVHGPGGHSLAGSSLGGLAALYTHLRRPEVFGGAIAMSPSLWFTHRKVDAWLKRQPTPYRSRIYLDAGATEGQGNTALLVNRLGAHLASRGWSDPARKHDLRVLVRIDAKGKHDEASWRRRLPRALRFLIAP